MKILTSNYITCAVKACKSSTLSFPLHFQDAELVQEEVDFNPEFIVNILPRIEWDALVVTAAEVCRLGAFEEHSTRVGGRRETVVWWSSFENRLDRTPANGSLDNS